MKAPYHTATKGGTLTTAAPAQYVRIGNSVALTHDLMRGLPPEFEACDVLFSEPPWRAGHAVFNERAGIRDGRTFNEFLSTLGAVIDSLSIPVYIICGREAMGLLPKARMFDISFNIGKGVCYAYRDDGLVAPTEMALLDSLAQRYECIGDPMCGYGKAARVFHRAGKRFVVSDFVPECIGSIAAELA